MHPALSCYGQPPLSKTSAIDSVDFKICLVVSGWSEWVQVSSSEVERGHLGHYRVIIGDELEVG